MTVMLVVFTVMLVDREMAGIIILRLFGYFLLSILSSSWNLKMSRVSLCEKMSWSYTSY